MFKFIKKITGAEEIKELIYTQNNNILANKRATEKLMREYEKDNIKLSQMLEHAKEVLEEKDKYIKLLDGCLNEQIQEVERLTKIIDDDKKFKEDVKSYLRTVATIITNIQKESLSKKMNATAYMRSNMTTETKAKLK